MNEPRHRTLLAVVLQAVALAVLVLALAGVAWRDDARPGLLVLVDRSASIPPAAADAALAEVLRAHRGRRVEVLDFAGRPGRPRDAALHGAPEDLQPSATRLDLALDAALAEHAGSPPAAALVISDGHATGGDTGRALQGAREAGLPLYWRSVARDPPEAWIAQVRAPGRARRGQPVEIEVALGGRVAPPLTVSLTARDASGAGSSASATPGATGLARLAVAAEHGGLLLLDVELQDAQTGQVLDARRNAAAVEVAEPARVLYLAGSEGALLPSLRAAGWPVEAAPASRADAYLGRLGGFETVVLDDVATADASEAFWHALAGQVTGRGLGLLVLGGGRSFARGGYRDSVLESVLPVLSEPAALDQPASVVFAVDKSGSMGETSAGVDRLSLAQRAVAESIRALGERDTAGVIAFDVETRVVLPLAPAREAAAALQGRWPVQARGGTLLAPGLEAAVRQLETAGGRRLLVLVTDGFVDDAPVEALGRRLGQLGIETLALAVGPDADVGALQRLVGRERGTVLRVGQAAQLPRAMTSGLEQRRARVAGGPIAVQQRLPLPFLPTADLTWPPVAACAVTRLRPGATAWLESETGDPLLATGPAGAGRVLALTSGLGRWTPAWLEWNAWPALAGGLVGWVGAAPGSGTVSLRVADVPDGLEVTVDQRDARDWTQGRAASLAVILPGGRTRPVELRPLAPGRLGARVEAAEPGPYTLVLSSMLGTQRTVHLPGSRAEDATWGESPAVEQWSRAGLVRRWDPAQPLPRRPRAAEPSRSVDRGLLALALLLFVTAVLVDRKGDAVLPRPWAGRRDAGPGRDD